MRKKYKITHRDLAIFPVLEMDGLQIKNVDVLQPLVDKLAGELNSMGETIKCDGWVGTNRHGQSCIRIGSGDPRDHVVIVLEDVDEKDV